MGKHSKVKEVRPRDFWPTVDPDAVKCLVPWIKGKTFAEPCCGNGDLVNLLLGDAVCKWESDLETNSGYSGIDATKLTKEDLVNCDYIITNPPFSWDLLQPLLDHFPTIKPTWLLLPSDFMHNKRSGPYMSKCTRVVSVGRLYWVLDEGVKPVKGKENYCWYFWPQNSRENAGTQFYGR